MGAQYSSVDGLKKNAYLTRLVGPESIDVNDPFWNQLLSFTYYLSVKKENSKLIDEATALLCQSFYQHNLTSGNFVSLIRVFCQRCKETRSMSDNYLMTMQTANMLLIIRCYTKFIIEIENEEALLEQLNVKYNPVQSAGGGNATAHSSSESPSSSLLLTSAAAAAAGAEASGTSSANASPQARHNHPPSQAPHGTNAANTDNDSGTEWSTSGSVATSFNPQIGKIQDDNVLYQLISSIIEMCVEVPVAPHTYRLHLEALNVLLVLLSVQMYTKKPTTTSYIFDIFMHKMDNNVSEFIRVLLVNTIQQMPEPSAASISAHLAHMADPSAGAAHAGSSSLLSSVTSGLWTVMTLGLVSSSAPPPPVEQSASSGDSSANQDTIVTYLPSLNGENNSSVSSKSGGAAGDAPLDCASRLLAWQSCHILLVLSNHCTNESLYNPYRLALFHFTDTQDYPTNIPNSEPLPWFSLNFTKLFHMFTFTLHSDQYMLLFYMLLHRNQHFKMFILSRLNIDLLIVPILKVIFTAPERNSRHIYMALIILLILSEDDIFNKTIHSIPIKKLNWYTERTISEISLGGLLILIVIRTIQFNMSRMRDKYLHTNCLAALANMSSKFNTLHPYVCQRINSLFGLLSKKRTKIINMLNTADETATASGSDNNSETSSNGGQDLLQDLAIIDELMRMFLEIINSCLTNNLHHNADLIYSLLYHKNIYLQFRDHPNFQDVIQNIDTIITSFSHDLDSVQDKSVENLKEVITQGVKQFPRDRLRKFPDLKFKYVEDYQPEEFFVPYVWTLVYEHSNLYWLDLSVKFESPNLISSDSASTASSIKS